LAAKNVLTQLPYQILLLHVKGHQDESKCMELSHEVLLNIKADGLAKQALVTLQEGPSTI